MSSVLAAPHHKTSQPAIERLVTQSSQVILGKEHQIRLAVTCLLAKGHLLIEDIPGVGKTTLAHVLAKSLGLDFQRIQFTSDLLPADILGVSVYERDSASFKFHPGPIFSQFILTDEINRATPKTQSALLEAMEERQVTIEGESLHLPDPFFVIATQNPANQLGTFPLPESQLDRFLMKIELGYPNPQAERAILKGQDRHDMIEALTPCMTIDELLDAQTQVREIHVADALLDYLQAILSFTRKTPEFREGLSPRAGLAMLHSAQAWAYMHGRNKVVPEDLQAVLGSVACHRLHSVSNDGSNMNAQTITALLKSVPIP